MAGTQDYPKLFSKITLAGRTLRNRVCMSATVTNYAAGNRITDRWKSYLIERARGGTAMLVTEVIAVDPNALAQGSTVIGFDDTNNADFRDTAERVEGEGSLLVGQLWHPGKQQLWHPTKSPMGVSDQPDAYSWTVPHVMSTAEVRQTISAYVDTAKRLCDNGFAGVELHGAHGYLISQFLSAWSNWREDEFGGSLENRVRFARGIAAGIRAACGPGFIIGIKIPGEEGVEGGIDVDEAVRITAELCRDGLFDYVSSGQGNFSLSLDTHVPDLYFSPAHYVDAVHQRLRAAANGTAVMALGRIGDPGLAETIIAENKSDLIGMTRALVTDAAWANKAQAGRVDEIRPCVFDNVSWGEVHLGKPVTDHNNPMCGQPDEADWKPTPAEKQRQVVVVGAGPAGLEAAWVAAARGHAVTLFGASDTPGGALSLEAELPGRAEMARIVDYQAGMCARHGVTLKLGAPASAADVRALNPDAVVLATGALQRYPTTLDPTSGPAVSARDYIASDGRVYRGARGTVVLFDQDHTAGTYGVADRLAEEFARVILITPRPEVAKGVNYCSAIGVMRRLYGAGVEIRPATEPVRLHGGVLEVYNPYSETADQITDVDLLIYATPRTATDDLAAELSDLELHLIGDCGSPRNLTAAIHGGHAVANQF